ncbi:hypothetical protein Pla175_16740 [Pirellulimonas nuda]|uniref:Putative restriction endonuclease domain-containing protein n=1 Tax=Pirellulimonas nuda TaxID=2528009 RepID=A0A518D9Z3_9BACT|nr:Uma2 family endonuclease [Pirellulimonas nuda]QDU88299.1 hypothetical protein Pla175_16740 [Pirellulimonas nuda]
MDTLILDEMLSEQIRQERADRGADRWDEVWDGVYIMAPLPNIEHQDLVSRLTSALLDGLTFADDSRVFAGVNVSDRLDDWKSNYRCPDVAVFLPESKAMDKESFFHGGPDFAVEVVSPRDRSREKLDFYASVGTTELLIVDRNPWALELWRLSEDELRCTGSARIDDGELSSTVIPFAFSLELGMKRAGIKVRQTADGRSWNA